jgi:hypothetical protein
MIFNEQHRVMTRMERQILKQKKDWEFLSSVKSIFHMLNIRQYRFSNSPYLQHSSQAIRGNFQEKTHLSGKHQWHLSPAFSLAEGNKRSSNPSSSTHPDLLYANRFLYPLDKHQKK